MHHSNEFCFEIISLFLLILDETAKKLYKYKDSSPNAFIGAINTQNMTQELVLESHINRFQNIMIISDHGKDLFKKLLEVLSNVLNTCIVFTNLSK